jgi:periplasmic protein TonB
MTDGGFLDNRTRSPLGLGLVVALHAAALAALILAKGPQIIPKLPSHPLIDILPDNVPPPEVPPPPPEAKAERPPLRIDRPPAVVDLPTVPTIALPPLPPVTPTIDAVETGPAVPADPPVAPAKLIEATLDARSAAQPDYPQSLARQEIEGVAVVRVTIGADGRVRDVALVRADDPAFFEATRRHALRSWRFRPATRDGVPVESVRTMTVRFRMG